uniref:Uncharacterized protein n=1 Tax=Meloidogyne enterolobii TaxID=390850 RepID=A0A6V7W7R9_MELEN|nr:unnamed protein product [Meloidogyne enterolobii]
MYKYNLRNPSCFAGYDYDTTSIILHTSTNAMFPGLSGYPNTKTDRYWYCFDYDGHCKDFYFVNGVKCDKNFTYDLEWKVGRLSAAIRQFHLHLNKLDRISNNHSQSIGKLTVKVHEIAETVINLNILNTSIF